MLGGLAGFHLAGLGINAARKQAEDQIVPQGSSRTKKAFLPQEKLVTHSKPCHTQKALPHTDLGDGSGDTAHTGHIMAKGPYGPRILAELAGLTLGPALAAQGFASREIIANWDMIAGPRLAGHCRPQKINWPKRRPNPDEEPEAAALVLRVESAFALEAQQIAPLMIQRVNTHLGWKAVDRVVLKQGPVERAHSASGPQLEDQLKDQPITEPVRKAVEGIADPDLQNAMARLGQAIASNAPRNFRKPDQDI